MSGDRRYVVCPGADPQFLSVDGIIFLGIDRLSIPLNGEGPLVIHPPCVSSKDALDYAYSVIEERVLAATGEHDHRYRMAAHHDHLYSVEPEEKPKHLPPWKGQDFKTKRRKLK